MNMHEILVRNKVSKICFIEDTKHSISIKRNTARTEMEQMRQKCKYETSQFALKMKNASKSNREKIDMQVKLQMMENELQKHQQEKSEFARKHAEAEQKKREIEEMHQQALLAHDEEKQMYKQQIKQSKRRGFASNLKMMSQKKKKEREAEEMRQQSEQRIAEEMAMYAEQQDEIKDHTKTNLLSLSRTWRSSKKYTSITWR